MGNTWQAWPLLTATPPPTPTYTPPPPTHLDELQQLGPVALHGRHPGAQRQALHHNGGEQTGPRQGRDWAKAAAALHLHMPWQASFRALSLPTFCMRAPRLKWFA